MRSNLSKFFRWALIPLFWAIAWRVAVFTTLMLIACFLLPSSAETERLAGSTKSLANSAHKQVSNIRSGINDLEQPDLQQSLEHLTSQANLVAKLVGSQSIEFETIITMRDAFGEIAQGLEAMNRMLDPQAVLSVSDSLVFAADFLDTTIAESSQNAANQIEVVSTGMQKSALSIQRFLEAAPMDFRAIEQLRNSLDSFNSTLTSVSDVTRSMNFAEEIKALQLTASSLDRFAGKAESVWLEDSVGKPLRQNADALRAMSDKVASTSKLLPQISNSVNESRKMIQATKGMLDIAMEQRAAVEPALKELPSQFAKLSEEFPKLSNRLTALLRETASMKKSAAVLRETSHRIREVGQGLPEIRKSISGSIALLSVSQSQLNHFITHRSTYEDALRQTVITLDSLSVTIPTMKTQLDRRLAEERLVLDSLEAAIEDADTVIDQIAWKAQLGIQFLRWTAILLAFVTISPLIKLAGRLPGKLGAKLNCLPAMARSTQGQQ